MIWKNIEIFNVGELYENEDGSTSWIRVPKSVYDKMDNGVRTAKFSTGVELRFVLHSEKAIIKMSTLDGNGRFHVYRGGIQGGWEDHEVNKLVGSEIGEFEIKQTDNIPRVQLMNDKCNTGWDANVIRVIFDQGTYKLYDIIGDVEPPKKEQCPAKTLLCYGSSITHASNSIDMSHSWASWIGYQLGMDVRNLGMAGSCCIEPEMVEYIAHEGELGNWSGAILELGVNILGMDKDEFSKRIDNIIKQVCGRNTDKPIYIVSPFYLCDEEFEPSCNAVLWREIIESAVKKANYKNVTYINGHGILGDITGISADFIHPSIYGVVRIADGLLKVIKSDLNK